MKIVLTYADESQETIENVTKVKATTAFSSFENTIEIHQADGNVTTVEEWELIGFEILAGGE